MSESSSESSSESVSVAAYSLLMEFVRKSELRHTSFRAFFLDLALRLSFAFCLAFFFAFRFFFSFSVSVSESPSESDELESLSSEAESLIVSESSVSLGATSLAFLDFDLAAFFCAFLGFFDFVFGDFSVDLVGFVSTGVLELPFSTSGATPILSSTCSLWFVLGVSMVENVVSRRDCTRDIAVSEGCRSLQNLLGSDHPVHRCFGLVSAVFPIWFDFVNRPALNGFNLACSSKAQDRLEDLPRYLCASCLTKVHCSMSTSHSTIR